MKKGCVVSCGLESSLSESVGDVSSGDFDAVASCVAPFECRVGEKVEVSVELFLELR